MMELNALCNDITQSACSFQCNFEMFQYNIPIYIGSLPEKLAKLIIIWSEGFASLVFILTVSNLYISFCVKQKSNSPMIDMFIKRLQKISNRLKSRHQTAPKFKFTL